MRAVSQRLVAHRTVLSGVHRTVRCGTGPYSREATDRRSLAVALDCPVCTGLSGVHRTVRCAPDRRQRSDPTVDCYRRQRSADVACTGHCTVDVRCTRQRLVWGVEAINTTPTGHSQVWEPKQHTKTHSAYFQVLKHPSA
jgi:hypothetical protein